MKLEDFLEGWVATVRVVDLPGVCTSDLPCYEDKPGNFGLCARSESCELEVDVTIGRYPGSAARPKSEGSEG
jgi:hypothetical protein